MKTLGQILLSMTLLLAAGAVAEEYTWTIAFQEGGYAAASLVRIDDVSGLATLAARGDDLEFEAAVMAAAVPPCDAWRV